MSGTNTTHQPALRSALGRVRGLGTAKSGAHHWWVQRMTAAALVPLSLWFIFLGILPLAGEPHAVAVAWIARPFNTVLLLALIIAMFYHLELGLTVVIEDYAHSDGKRLVGFVIMRACVWLLGLTAAFSVLRIAL